MPTQNPKISAYVPQVVYDSFKQYEKKHGGSMSQALTQLIADHLGIDLSTFTIKSTGGLQSEIKNLHIEINHLKDNLVDLKLGFANLLEKVEYISTTSSLRKNSKSLREKVEVSSQQENNFFSIEEKSLDASVFQEGTLNDTSTSINDTIVKQNKEEVLINQDISEQDFIVPKEFINEKSELEPLSVKKSIAIQDNTNNESKSDLQLELLSKPKLEKISELKPLTASSLSRRFGKDDGFVKAKKNYYKDRPERLRVIFEQCDPDGIFWQYSETDKKYHPTS